MVTNLMTPNVYVYFYWYFVFFLLVFVFVHVFVQPCGSLFPLFSAVVGHQDKEGGGERDATMLAENCKSKIQDFFSLEIQGGVDGCHAG